MAYQHFYSRVPSKVSMFNKADGFDTFASSSIFSRSYVDDELVPVLNYAPGKYEASYIRTGSLPPVYWRYVGSQGQVVVSCVSFMPRDYTGERSSWLIHTLVPNDDERASISRATDRQIINPECFTTDISGFKITYANASPIKDYPELAYSPLRVSDVEQLTTQYSPSQLKKLIYALLAVACGKCKAVYIGAGKDTQTISQEALALMNRLLQVFPHNVRDRIPFITYTTEYNKLNTFAVKFLPSDCMTMPPSKGIRFDLPSKESDGIKEADFASAQMLVEFFYSLLADKPLRLRFVKYALRAAETDKTLQEPNFKNLNAIVTLFKQVSKAYTEKQVLPDDARVLEMFSIYEKYRNILSPKERCTVYGSLERYIRLHQAIPSAVFTKVSKLYPKETPHVKSCVMRIMLEMIHTDIMRDKLFAFIKNNFDAENARGKSIICRHLIRVYYGGFLQHQILSLLDGCFAEQSEGTQDFVLEKLLLSIRTQDVREQLFEFFENQYGVFTEEQKKTLYKTLLSSLDEADDLSVAVVQFVDKHVGKEPKEVSQLVSDQIVSILDAECRRENELIKVLSASNGFCLNAVLPSVLLWTSRKVFTKYVDIVSSANVAKATEMLCNCFVAVPSPSAEAVGGLNRAVDALASKQPTVDFFRIADAYSKVKRFVSAKSNSVWNKLADRLATDVLQVALCSRVLDCFCIKPQVGCVEKASKFIAANEFLQSEPLSQAVCAAKCVLDGELPSANMKGLCKMLGYKRERESFVQCLEEILADSKNKISADKDVEYLVDVCALASLLGKGSFNWEDVYRLCFAGTQRKYEIAFKEDTKKLANAAKYASVDALAQVLRCCARMRASDAPQQVRNVVIGNDNNSLSTLVAKCTSSYGKGILKEVADICVDVADDEVMATVKPAKTGISAFFEKLFKK